MERGTLSNLITKELPAKFQTHDGTAGKIYHSEVEELVEPGNSTKSCSPPEFMSPHFCGEKL